MTPYTECRQHTLHHRAPVAPSALDANMGDPFLVPIASGSVTRPSHIQMLVPPVPPVQQPPLQIPMGSDSIALLRQRADEAATRLQVGRHQRNQLQPLPDFDPWFIPHGSVPHSQPQSQHALSPPPPDPLPPHNHPLPVPLQSAQPEQLRRRQYRRIGQGILVREPNQPWAPGLPMYIQYHNLGRMSNVGSVEHYIGLMNLQVPKVAKPVLSLVSAVSMVGCSYLPLHSLQMVFSVFSLPRQLRVGHFASMFVNTMQPLLLHHWVVN